MVPIDYSYATSYKLSIVMLTVAQFLLMFMFLYIII